MSVLARKIAVLSLILSSALGLRLYQLGTENFWIDEVAYVIDASQSPKDIVNYRTATRTRVHHVTPLPHLVAHFFLSPENTEKNARLPSAIFGSLEVLLVYTIGWQLFSYPVALLAALFLALSPLHLWYSQEARWYAQWSFMTTATYLALLYAWRKDRASSWIAYTVTTLLNVYTFVYTCFIIMLQSLGMAWSQRVREDRRGLLLKFVMAQAFVIAGALPILLMIFRGLGKSSGTPREVGLGDLPYTFFAYAAGFSAGPTLGELHDLPPVYDVIAEFPVVLVFFAAFFPALILGLRAVIRNPLASGLLLPWLFGLPVLVFLVATATTLTYQIRYTVPALPAFALVLACGVWSIQSESRKWIFAGAIAGCSLFSIGNFYWNARYDKEQVSAALARIKSVEARTSPVVTIGQIGSTAKYYGQELDFVINNEASCDSGKVDHLTGQGRLRNSDTVWVIAGRDWQDRAATCLKKFGQRYSIVDHQRFTGTDLWLLKRRS